MIKNLLKSKLFLISAFVLAIFNISSAQNYCTPSHSGLACAAGDLISNVKISGTTLDNVVNGCVNGRYETYSANGSTTATLYATTNYNIYNLSVTSTANSIISVWIDFNQNDTFESAEWWQVSTASGANTAATVSITIPTNATLGQTGMRVRSRAVNNQNGAGDACLTFGSGMTHDYTVTIDTLSACTGTPTAGTVLAVDSICSGLNLSLGVTGGTFGSGQTYQWQSSSDNTTWNDISGATSLSIYSSIMVDTYFRFYTVCSGSADTSASKQVVVKPFYLCYCSSAAINTVDDDIGKFTFGNFTNGIDSVPALNNSTSNQLYSDFTSLTPDTFDALSKYFMEVTQINSGNYFTCNAKVYIDYNQDGQFDNSEVVFSRQSVNPATLAYGNVMKDSVLIPSTAEDGVTRLRVVLTETGVAANVTPCGSYNWGETEDYLVYIRVPVCNTTPTAGMAVSSLSPVCPATPFTLSLQGNTYGKGQTYQWQSSTDTINWTNVNGATKGSYIAQQSSDKYYRAYLTCGGNTDTSDWVFVSSTPFFNCYCTPVHPACNAGDQITNVTIQGTSLNNSPSACPTGAVNPYYTYPASGSTTANLSPGQTVQLDVTTNNSAIISVWIDYDQSGTYDASEWTQVTTNSTANTASSVSITIPANAITGQTGMRIRSRLNGNQNGSGDACLNMGSGQAHDYVLLIASPIALDASIAAVTAPGDYGCYSNAEPASVLLYNAGYDTLDFSLNNIRVTMNVSGGISTTLDTTITSGRIAPSDTMTVNFSGTLDLSALNTTYNFTVYAKMVDDSNAYNDSNIFVINTVQPFSLNYIDDFNNLATIPTTYLANGFTTTTTNGVGSTGSLRASMNAVITASLGNTPIVGPLTANSAFKFSYRASTQLANTDSVAVYLTTDCGKTFNQIFSIDASNTNSNKYVDFVYDLGAFAGSNAAVVFYSVNNGLNTYTVDIDNVVIGDKPTVDLGPDSSSCSSVLLNANPTQNSNYDIVWNNNSNYDTLTAITTGTYWATVTDFLTGLSATDSVNIKIYSAPTVNLGNNVNGCGGTAIMLDAGNFGAGYQYLWSTGDSTQTVNVTTAGTYSVTVVTPGGCFGQDDISVSFTSAPTGVSIIKGSSYNGSFNNGTSTNPDAVCTGNSVEYELTPPTAYGNAGFGTSWVIKGYSIATVNGSVPSFGTYTVLPASAGNATLSFTPSSAEADSTYILMVSVKDSTTGCDTIVSRFLKVNALPKPSLGSDVSICPTKSAIFNAGSYSSYLWSNGSTSSSLSTSSAGNVWVKVTDVNGCSNTDTANVSIYNVTPVNLGNDKGFCPGTSLTLDAGAGASYAWSSGAATKTISVSAASTYFVDVTDANGCVTRDSINIALLPAPNAAFSSVTVNGLSTNVQYTATDATAGNIYAWDFGDGNSSSQQNPLHVFATNGSYNVKLTVTNSSTCTDNKTNTTVVNTGILTISDKVNGIEVYPNPFKESTILSYSINTATQLTIELFDITGRKVATLLNAKQSVGNYQLPITSGSNLSGGVYTVRITANGETASVRIVEIK
ncbi:MAG: T9SS type A sorting domain-containing protein [Bacteroidetes bacterium]|nr:T9SS type A sorting domain-containing protein [Bacteroidota bacterium]